MSINKQAGVTLIELIVAMVIIAAALAGLLAAQNSTGKRSADPMINKQMAAVAEGLLEEIVLKPYAEAGNDAPALNGRDTFNDVRDYAGYRTAGVYDNGGTAVPGLNDYSVSVDVQQSQASNVPLGNVLLITVTVEKGELKYVLTGWRMDYAGGP